MLGKLLVHHSTEGKRAGRIVEVEAYVGAEDRANHASRGRTPRTAVMFGPPGHAYVYLIYGMHYCFNAVTEREGYPAAVLVRALEPVENVSLPTNGPGRLCRAMGIDRHLDGADLTDNVLLLADDGIRVPAWDVVQAPRVGVAFAGEWAALPWRFYVRGNPFVSRAR
jgi:DNA-3-methyladenine glycosylase